MIWKSLLAIFAMLFVGLFAWSHYRAMAVRTAFPPIGAFADLPGTRLHYLDVAPTRADAPAVVFIHGATGNLQDLQTPFSPLLEGDMRLIFVDRPGLGHSSRADQSFTDPARQAKAVADLLDHLDIEKAVIAAHSLAGATAMAFALNHADKAHGLALMAPVSHPWTTGVDWYYDLSNTPVLGWLFANTLAVPGVDLRMKSGAQSVFAPAPKPENYVEASALPLIQQPRVFRNNALDVARILPHVERMSKRYGEIQLPIFAITGREDTVVSPFIHIKGIERDIAHAETVWLDDVGHKPDYAATQLIAEKIRKMAGL